MSAGSGKEESRELAVALSFQEFFEGVVNSELKETTSRGLSEEAKS